MNQSDMQYCSGGVLEIIFIPEAQVFLVIQAVIGAHE